MPLEAASSKKLPLSSPRILIMTAVSAEREAVLRGLCGDSRFDVLLAGVGPAAAAASTARALAKGDYALAISAGIGGGFPGQAEIGSLVVASQMIAADLGAETPDGFSSVDELGFGASRVQADAVLAARLAKALQAGGLPVCLGPVLTVSTVTGTARSALEMAARVPGAAAEGMEGYGVAIASSGCEIPVLEIRAISNTVGPRDRAAWRIGEALAALEAATIVITEVLE